MNSWIPLQGFALGLSMIIPIGAQNAFVLNQGIKKQHHLTTATICSICDIVLISIGIFGGGALLASNQTVLTLITLAGIIFLTFYGFNSLKEAYNASSSVPIPNNDNVISSRRAVIAGALAVTLLNPHVYLDTVVILGSIGGQFNESDRVLFAIGTLTASFTWFYGLSLSAAKLSSTLSKVRVKQTIDILVAAMMFYIATKLALSLIH
ncbi:MAG: LysE family transporter [Aliivibrio sp.]|uniref:LysE/ArgO family amino acid transporter n=1 Tax=Aliivibrio sp. TaxID=1872443 RepID=UPI001A55476E|nr:LysE family transporter [Aliivibrio sp.]